MGASDGNDNSRRRGVRARDFETEQKQWDGSISFGRGGPLYLLSAEGDLAAEWYFSRRRFLYISWFCHRSDAMMFKGLEVFGSGDVQQDTG